MTKSICYFNRKGGTGKTSITGAMACELTQNGQRVLMVDIDSQANLSEQFLGKKYKNELADVLSGECSVQDAIHETKYENLYIIPSLSLKNDGKIDEWTKTEAGRPQNRNKIKRLIQAVSQYNFDFILWDFCPSYTDLSQLVLLAADEVIAVMRIDAFSIDGLQELYQLLDELKDGEDLPVFKKLILNGRDKRIAYQNSSIELLESNPLTKYIIPNDTAFTNAQFDGVALQALDVKKETRDILNIMAQDLINENKDEE